MLITSAMPASGYPKFPIKTPQNVGLRSGWGRAIGGSGGIGRCRFHGIDFADTTLPHALATTAMKGNGSDDSRKSNVNDG